MLPDAVGVMKKINRAAVEAVEATKPVNVLFGKVISVSPLQINVEQKMNLGEKQLTLSRSVTDFKTFMTISGIGKTEITVHNGLAVGDKVILLRKQGGQEFVVLDRSTK